MGRRLKKNPALMIVANPPRRALSDRVYAVEYRHAKDGKDYRHDFKRGVRAVTNRGGTVRLESEKGARLHRDISGQRFLVNPPKKHVPLSRRKRHRPTRAESERYHTEKARELAERFAREDRERELKRNPHRKKKSSTPRKSRRRRSTSARAAKRRRSPARKAPAARAASPRPRRAKSMAKRKRRRNPARRAGGRKRRRGGVARRFGSNPPRRAGRRRSFRRNPRKGLVQALMSAAIGGTGVTLGQIGTVGASRLIPAVPALGNFEAIAKQLLAAGVVTVAAEYLIGGKFAEAIGYGAFAAPQQTALRQFAPAEVSTMLGEYDRCRTAGYVRGYVPGRRPAPRISAYTKGGRSAPSRGRMAGNGPAGGGLDPALQMVNMM